jgi:hypothetical protein
MPHDADARLSSIHAMLAAGHRNLRIERHTLVLWGLMAGGLMLSSDVILTDDQFTSRMGRPLAWLALIAASVGMTSLVDWHLTKRRKRVRDEAWSFIHRQIIKIWWTLMSIGTLLTFATFFYGGSHMLYAAWIVLFGLGIYIHGLFSDTLLEWAGGTMMLIGIGSLAAGLDSTSGRLLGGTVFALGLPLLALMLDNGRARAGWMRPGLAALWATFVLGTAVGLDRLSQGSTFAEIPALTEPAFRAGAGAQGTYRVLLPAGTPVSGQMQVTGSLFRPATIDLPLTLAAPLQVLVRDGVPTGDISYDGGAWVTAWRSGWIALYGVKASLTPADGARARTTARFDLKP